MAAIIQVKPFLWYNMDRPPEATCMVDSDLAPLIDDMVKSKCHMEGEEYAPRQIELRIVSEDGRILDICEGEGGDGIRDEASAMLRREGWLKA